MPRTRRSEGYRFSFDMLGEAARTADDAERYAARYHEAVEAIAAWAGLAACATSKSCISRPGLSVKLSALHPRYQPAQEGAAARRTAAARARACARHARGVAAAHHRCRGAGQARAEPWRFSSRCSPIRRLPAGTGLGSRCRPMASARCPLIDWLARRLTATGRRIPVRLVKGAYWDSEIKWAQEAGLAGYPVFTRKVDTDVAYLAAARTLLARPDALLPAIRHPQRPYHRRHRRAGGDRDLRVPAALRHGRGAASRGGAAGSAGQAVPHLCAGRRPRGSARLSRAPAARERRQHLLRQSARRRRGADRDIVADPVEKAARLEPRPIR